MLAELQTAQQPLDNAESLARQAIDIATGLPACSSYDSWGAIGARVGAHLWRSQANRTGAGKYQSAYEMDRKGS